MASTSQKPGMKAPYHLVEPSGPQYALWVERIKAVVAQLFAAGPRP